MSDSGRNPAVLSVEEKRRVLAERLQARARRRYPLSATQRRFWFFEVREPGTSVLHIRFRLRFRTTPDVEVLRLALDDLTRRHDTLRTSIDHAGDDPVQIVESRVVVPFEDWETVDQDDAALMQRFLAFADRPFEFATGPLWRSALVRIAHRESQLLLVFHHMIADGLSALVFARDLTELYEARVQSRPSRLPLLAVSYGEYAEQQVSDPSRFDADLQYWRTRLQPPLPVLDLPRDFERPRAGSFAGGMVRAVVPRKSAEHLLAVSREAGATLFMTMLAAFHLLVARLSGTTDVIVGSPVAGRVSAGVEPLIGVFINTVAIRVPVDPAESFGHLLARVREAALGAYAHQDVPFDSVVADLRIERHPARTPVFQVLMNMLGSGREGQSWLEPIDDDETTSKFDLTVYVVPAGANVALRLAYNTILFSHARMEALLQQYVQVLEQISPARICADFDLVTASARDVLPDPAAPLVPQVPAPSLAERLQTASATFADRHAVRAEGTAWTYAELDGRSEAVCRAVEAARVGPGQLVAVYAARSAGLVAAVAGVVRSGAAFCLLDPAWPEARLVACVEVAKPSAWLSVDGAGSAPGGLQRAFDRLAAPRLSIAETNTPPAPRAADRVAAVPAARLAYVAFTSGTTGGIKAVAGREAPLTHFLEWHSETFEFDSADRFSLISGLGHDPLLRDLFTPLWNGATVVVPPAALLTDPGALAAWFHAERITVAHLTPQHATVLVAGLDERGLTLDELRYVFLAGDVLTPAVLDGLRRTAPAAACVNFYGATETPQAMGWWVAPSRAASPALPAIGRGIDGVQLLVVNAAGRLAGIGELGEIWIRTPFLTDGYLDDPALTGERFVVNPFTGHPEDTVYRTGDLGRFRPDGTVEFEGRRDLQVKVRGYRVELQEVQQLLVEHPDVRDAAVVARRGEAGDTTVVACVVPAGGATSLNVSSLRTYLGAHLADYAIPDRFECFERLPLTPNGKVDRQALVSGAGAVMPVSGYVEPATDTERLVASIFQEVLAVDDVGRYDNFFERGGHSLLAIRVITRLRTRTGTRLPLGALFEAPVVAMLAQQLESLRAEPSQAPGAPGTVAAPAAAAPAWPKRYPVSLTQKRLWFFEALQPGTGVLHLRFRSWMTPAPDERALRAALAALATRHDTLRTAIDVVDGEPWQVVSAPGDVPLSVMHVEGDAETVERTLAETYETWASRPFDLGRGPLWRILLAHTPGGRAQLMLAIHHLVADGSSMAVFMRDVNELYRAALEQREAALPPLTIQYGDYAVRQVEDEGRLREELDYWRARLADLPRPLDLPADYVRGRQPAFSGAAITREIPGDLVSRLRAVGRRRDATLFMTLLAAFKVLLSRLTGMNDIVVGAPVAGRLSEDVESLIGVFINTVAVRTRLDRDSGFVDALAQVREAVIGAFAHQEVPFDTIVAELQLGRRTDRSPVFQVLFNMIDVAPAAVHAGAEAVPDESAASKFDLTLYVFTRGEAVRFRLVYDVALFAEGRMQEFLRQYEALLDQVAAEPERSLAAHRCLTAAAAARLPDPSAPRPEPLAAPPLAAHLGERIAAGAAAPAVEDARRTWTYGALGDRMVHVHAALDAAGVGLGDVVMVWADRSADLVAVLAGIVRSGAAFSLLDPAWPAARLTACIDAAGPAAWFEIEGGRPMPDEVRRTLDDRGAIPVSTAVGRVAAPAAVVGSADRLAYVGFTSGTTGGIKAIAGTEGPLTHFFAWQARTFALTSADRFAMLSGLGHDPLLRDVFTPLWIGAAIVVPDADLLRDAERLASWFRTERITVAHLTPQHALTLAAGVEVLGGQLPSLRYLFFGGDVLTPAILRTIRAIAPSVQCVNFYGATETPQAMSWWVAEDPSAADEPERAPVVGRGIDGVQLLVVDDGGRLAGIGELGEIWIRTSLLSLGYLNDPALTAQRFITNPFTGEPGDTVYRTGDLGRFGADGQVEFVGRRDAQVKIRGFRVELQEIEQILASHPDVRTAAVVVRRTDGADGALVACLVPVAPDAPPDGAVLRTYLAAHVPEYSIPDRFEIFDRLPLTASGKIDRAALDAAAGRQLRERAWAAPETPWEKTVAGLFEEVLQSGPIGRHESFFERGGHSLLAVQVMVRLRRRTGVDLPLRTLFDAPTVADLAVAIAAAGDGATDADGREELEF